MVFSNHKFLIKYTDRTKCNFDLLGIYFIMIRKFFLTVRKKIPFSFDFIKQWDKKLPGRKECLFFSLIIFTQVQRIILTDTGNQEPISTFKYILHSSPRVYDPNTLKLFRKLSHVMILISQDDKNNVKIRCKNLIQDIFS